jgi:hypothetical protein
MESRPEGRTSVGRPELRGMDGVLEDLRKLGVKSWWIATNDRNLGGKFFGKPGLMLGCSTDDDDDEHCIILHRAISKVVSYLNR